MKTMSMLATVTVILALAAASQGAAILVSTDPSSGMTPTPGGTEPRLLDGDLVGHSGVDNRVDVRFQDITAVFDLGESSHVTGANISYVTCAVGAVLKPAGVDFYFSSDGVFNAVPDQTFTAVGPWHEGGGTWDDSTETATTDGIGQYLKVVVRRDAGVYSYGNAFLMLYEIQPQFTPIPEPATMSVMVLGGVAALLRRRRR